MDFLKKTGAFLAGIVVFIAIMALIPSSVDLISQALLTTAHFPGGQPPARFVLAIRVPGEGDAKESYEPATWDRIPTIRKSGKKFSFLLAAKSGELTGHGDLYAYTVIEDRKTSQIIEVKYANTHTSWSRYEAFDDRIVPISYRTDGGLLALIPMLAMLMLAVFMGRFTTRRLRRAFGVVGEGAGTGKS